MNRVSPTASSDSSTRRLRSAPLSDLWRSGRSTLLRTEAQGMSERLYSWNTSAIASGGSVTGFPWRTAWPRLGGSRPATHLRRVVFPQPDGPTTQTNSFSATVNEMLRIASVAFSPVPYVLPRSSISSTSLPPRYCGVAARQPRCQARIRRSASMNRTLSRYPSTPMRRIAAHIGVNWNVFLELSST